MTPGLDEFLKQGRERKQDETLTLVTKDVLQEILKRLARLEERLDKLEKQVDDLKKQATRTPGGGQAKPEARKRLTAFQRALDAMNEKGYVSLRADLQRVEGEELERVLRRLEQMGGVKLDLGNDVIVVHPTVYREFRDKLEKVSERDPVACVELFGRAGRLFNELYRRGAIYYDSKQGRWRIV